MLIEGAGFISNVFIIRNQLGHYSCKSGSWVNGGRAGPVACWKHKYEAVNTLFEIGSGNIELRCEIMLAETDTEQPTNLDISEHPLPKADREEGVENNAGGPTNG